MNNKKQAVFFLIIILGFACYPLTGEATSSESEVGITFTEKDSIDSGSNRPIEKDNDRKSNKNIASSDMLPKTGEKTKSILLITGLVLVTSTIAVKTNKKRSVK